MKFERSRREEYYALYFETKMLYGRLNNRDYKPIFHRFSNILVKFFCKGPWLVYSNIIYTKICVSLTITTFLLISLLFL